MHFLKLLFLACLATLANTALADDNAYQQCTKAITYYETQYKLPKNLLHSIATVESGKWNKQHNRVLAYPWTLNVEGKAHYFANQEEAVIFLKQMLARGIEQIDVGCAQINWHYHGKKYFKKPEYAFNPVFNIAYAAHLLSKHYEETKSWNKAVAIYHSRTEEKGKNYAAKVHKVWHTYSPIPHKQKTKNTVKQHRKLIIGQGVINHYPISHTYHHYSANNAKTVILP